MSALICTVRGGAQAHLGFTHRSVRRAWDRVGHVQRVRPTYRRLLRAGI